MAKRRRRRRRGRSRKVRAKRLAGSKPRVVTEARQRPVSETVDVSCEEQLQKKPSAGHPQCQAICRTTQNQCRNRALRGFDFTRRLPRTYRDVLNARLNHEWANHFLSVDCCLFCKMHWNVFHRRIRVCFQERCYRLAQHGIKWIVAKMMLELASSINPASQQMLDYEEDVERAWELAESEDPASYLQSLSFGSLRGAGGQYLQSLVLFGDR